MCRERELQEIAYDVWEDDGGRVQSSITASEQEATSLANQLRRQHGEPDGKAHVYSDNVTATKTRIKPEQS